MRAWGVGCGLLLMEGTLGCNRVRQSGPKVVGSDLPVVSPSSVALPGATDAADAPHAPSVTEPRNSDLTTYRDPVSGVSFRYPTIWRPATGQGLAPDFVSQAGPPRITQQFTSAGNFYAATTLEALTFSYTVKPHSTAASCAALPAKALGDSAVRTVPATYGGVSFAEATGGDSGACQHVATQLDTTLRGSQCMVFERDFNTSCPFVKSSSSPRPLTGEETGALQRHLDDVMKSVQISVP